MIPKVIFGKGGTRRLIAYLFGKGKANEHTDPHLVASWNGYAPDPGRVQDRHPKDVEKQLAVQLDQPVAMLGRSAPETTIWHCPVRAAREDRILSDEEWADIARRILAAAGIAPEGDAEACRWIAVRHAADHIHIAATLVRQDGRKPRRDHDIRAVQKEARRIEIDYGLRRLKPGDGTAAKRPTSREHFKAERQGRAVTVREILRTRVRRAVAAAASEHEFFALLEAMGVDVKVRTAPSGDLLGYNVSLPGDTNVKGEPVWFSGSTLAADLSLPKIRERLAAGASRSAARPRGARPSNPWHQATAAAERIPSRLTDGDHTVAQGQLAALGEALDLLPIVAPQPLRAELQQAAVAFERATRSRITADHASAQTLRRSVKAIVRDPVPAGDGAGIAMLLDAALIAVAYAMHWHRRHQHAQQEEATKQTLGHLQNAYTQIAGPVLENIARRAPNPQTKRRFAHHIQQAAPEHAQRILHDPAWDALATVLAEAEAAGHNTATVLDQALRVRILDDARSPARTLIWRIHRLGQRHAPSTQAQTAKIRSGHAPQRSPSVPQPRPMADEATTAPRRPRR